MTPSAISWRSALALAASLLVVVWTFLAVSLPTERLGDRLQLALPAVGLACAAVRGGAADYAGRFAGLLVAAHGTKAILGDAPLNRRPKGGNAGFPSAHTAVAVFGASYLARECGGLVPYAGPVLAVGAAFVGGTRIEAQRHTLPQVLAGAVYGLAFDLGLRSAASRRALRRTLRSVAIRLRWLTRDSRRPAS
ncbi:MAG: phosphatase PAP2 family protein [Amaricoccus sp.]